jgi:hypothetical protein
MSAARQAVHTDDAAEVYERARGALRRIKSGRQWCDWLEYGEGLRAARAEALSRANTEDISANAYRLAMSDVLREQRLDEDGDGFDKIVRSHVMAVMDNLPAIEQWRSTLSDTDRVRWNFPSTVLQHWRAAVREADEPEDTREVASAMRSLRRSSGVLSAEQTAERYDPDNPPDNALSADGAAEVFPDVEFPETEEEESQGHEEAPTTEASIETEPREPRKRTSGLYEGLSSEDREKLDTLNEFRLTIDRMHQAYLRARKVAGAFAGFSLNRREHLV